MSKKIDIFQHLNLDYSKKSGIKICKSTEEPKATKILPVYQIDGEDYLFKPLSKTKPFCTIMFAYAEVYWSYLINKYFDNKAPLYQLGICRGIDDHDLKHKEKGVLVKSFLKPNQTLTSLYDYFQSHPEDAPECLKNYINYCDMIYDYREIFETKLFQENQELSEQLAYRILISMVIRDQNFHYANNGLILEDGQIISLNPPIDSEFSTMFLRVDKPFEHQLQTNLYDFALHPNFHSLYEDKTEEDFQNITQEEIELIVSTLLQSSLVFQEFGYGEERKQLTEEQKDYYLAKYLHLGYVTSTQKKNLEYIAQNFPSVCQKFYANLNLMIKDLKESELIPPDDSFHELVSSDEWQSHRRYYKNIGRTIKQNRIKQNLTRSDISKKTDLSYAYLKDLETHPEFAMLSPDMLYLVNASLGIDTKEMLEESNKDMEFKLTEIIQDLFWPAIIEDTISSSELLQTSLEHYMEKVKEPPKQKINTRNV